MNKEELVNTIASATGLTKKDSSAAVDATIKAITTALKNDEKVTLVGFGTFEVKTRAEKEGRNPQTGESMKIPQRNLPVFTAGKNFKQLIIDEGNKKKANEAKVAKKTPKK